MRVLHSLRKSAVPEGGWTAESFAGEAGLRLVQDTIAVQRSGQQRGAVVLAPILRKMMKDQVERIIKAATQQYANVYGVHRRAEVVLSPESHANLWAAAIEAEMRMADLEVIVQVQPVLQSVAGDIHGKVGILLGNKPTAAQVSSLGARVRDIGRKITSINDTTRNRVAQTVAKGIKEGDTVFTVADKVRERIPQIATNRVPTIVRTEMSNVSNIATTSAMKESNVVTHVSVIGCEAVEPNIPTLDGIPTCNIRGVPIERSSELEFHPNHTGMIVMDGMVHADGEKPEIEMRGGVGDGIPEGG